MMSIICPFAYFINSSFPFEKELMQRHEQVEDLLESDLLDFSSVELKVSQLESAVQNIEEMVSC